MKACYVYEKCFLESKEYFGISFGIIRHVEMILRQERVTFVDIQEMTLLKSQSLILDAPKIFLKSCMRLRFWPVDYVLWIFKACYACNTRSIESKKNSVIHYMTIRHVDMISRQERVNSVKGFAKI